MNNYYILGFAAAVLLVLIFLTTGEFKRSNITPDYVPYIPSQEGPSRGGNMMYKYADLGVPGWKWDDCCSA